MMPHVLDPLFPVSPSSPLCFNRPMSSARLQRSLRATFLGMIANTLLAMSKLVAGVAGHSHALVADAVESLADVVWSGVGWGGLGGGAGRPGGRCRRVAGRRVQLGDRVAGAGRGRRTGG